MSYLDEASLLMIPSGYKEDKIFTQLPEDGSGDLTFTRASDGTRVNSEGYIERVPWNLVQYSEQFDNAVWNKTTGIVVTANAEISPDGTQNADYIQMGAANRLISQSTSLSVGVSCAASVYIKGTAGETIKIAAGGVDSANITLTGEWQRITHSATSINRVLNVNTFGGATARNFYLWGAQLVEGPTAKPYIATTNRQDVPRLDYSNGCPCLLLEPQRTNLVKYSEQFDNGAWVKIATTSTANSTLSPDGTTNADAILETTATGVHYTRQDSIPTTALTAYTTSVYVKANGRNYLAILNPNASGGSKGRYFSIPSDGTGSVLGVLDGTPTDSAITYFGNGWYRCSITTTAASTSISPRIYISDTGSNISFTGDIAKGLFLYGFQCEAGSYPTSYIPTTSAAVTRLADAAISYNSSALPTAYPFTLFAEVDVPLSSSTGNAISFGDTASSNAYYDVEYYSDKWVIVARPNGAVQSLETTIAPTAGKHKIAAVYTSTNMTLYVDGVNAGSKTHSEAFNSNINDLLIGQLRVPSDTGNRNSCYQALVFDSALTNDQLAALTTI